MSDSNHNGPSFIVFLWVRLRVLTTNLYALATGKSSFMAGVVLFNSANSIVTCDTTAFPPGVFCTVETVINKCPRFPPSEEVLLPQHHSWTSWTDLTTSQEPVRGPSGLAQAGSSSQTGHNLWEDAAKPAKWSRVAAFIMVSVSSAVTSEHRLVNVNTNTFPSCLTPAS